MEMKNKNVFLGVVLFILGLLWLLSNLNLFDYNMNALFRSFGDLWPLIIVLVGASMILQNKVAERVLWILFLLLLVGYSIFLQVGNPFSNRIDGNQNGAHQVPVTDTYSYPLYGTLQEGELNLQIGATRFTVDDISSDNVLELDTTIENLYVDVAKNGVVKIDISNQGNWVNIGDSSDNRLNLGLYREIPWTIEMEGGAIDADLDLSSIPLKSMDLSMGAGDLSLRLGALLDKTTLNLKSGVSQVDLFVPQDAALIIHMTGALNDTNIDSLGLIKEGNTYKTPDAQGGKTLELNLEMGLGQLNINRY